MFIDNDVKEYLIFVSQVKNLSENTTKSYKRDLKKLSFFLSNLKISNYSEINADICSAWIGDLYSGSRGVLTSRIFVPDSSVF